MLIGRDNRYEQKSDANVVNSAICEYLLAARKLRSSGVTHRTYPIGGIEAFGMKK